MIHKTEGEVTLTARVFFKNGSHKTITVKGVGEGLPEGLNYSLIELSQRLADAIPGVVSKPDVHKQKSPFYENYGENDAPGFFIGMRFAKHDATQKLFKGLDAIVAEPKKSK